MLLLNFTPNHEQNQLNYSYVTIHKNIKRLHAACSQEIVTISKVNDFCMFSVHSGQT